MVIRISYAYKSALGNEVVHAVITEDLEEAHEYLLKIRDGEYRLVSVEKLSENPFSDREKAYERYARLW